MEFSEWSLHADYLMTTGYLHCAYTLPSPPDKTQEVNLLSTKKIIKKEAIHLMEYLMGCSLDSRTRARPGKAGIRMSVLTDKLPSLGAKGFMIMRH